MSLYVGAHLVTRRVGYTHHGIYIGNGRVIHYSGLADGFNVGPVEETALIQFLLGKKYTIKEHPSRKYSNQESVKRARSRIGENCYSLFNNNCEHFVNWCIYGNHNSKQVNLGTKAASIALSQGAKKAGTAVVASAGSVAGLSGSGVMSGLATVGSAVGGGAVAGIGVIGGVGGAAAAMIVNNTVLADNPALDKGERESRAIGRAATYAGAATGTAGSITAVGAMGTTAGLSGAGITSGLAAVGGTVGGGMAVGVAVTAVAPVAAAVAVGIGIYKVVKWFKE